MEDKIIASIDLGTTNSTCSIGRYSNSRLNSVSQVKIDQIVHKPDLPNSIDEDDILPSIVWLKGLNEFYTGTFCKILGADIAKYKSSKLIRSIKRNIGNKSWSAKNGNIYLHPREVSGFLLRTIYKSLKKRIGQNQIDYSVITIPSSFSSLMRFETLKAAEFAGFDLDTTALIDEPIAALFSLWQLKSENISDVRDDSHILVFDMGGGTLDVSILNISQKDKTIRVISTSRYNELAGDDIDLEIAALILKRTREQSDYNHFLEMTDSVDVDDTQVHSVGYGLLEIAEEIKQELSDLLEDGPRYGSFSSKIDHYRDQPRGIKVDFGLEFPDPSPKTIELPVFEILQALEPFFSDSSAIGSRNIFIPINQAISRSGLHPQDINLVMVTGGSSFFPPVIDSLAGYFYKAPVRLDPFYAVSKGAAVWEFLKHQDDWNITETFKDSIFLKRTGNPFLQILEPMEIPSGKIQKVLEDDECPYLSTAARNLKLEFFQGTTFDDPNMNLCHVEYISFERELSEDARLTEIEAFIDENKIFNFNLIFQDELGQVDKSIAFGLSNNHQSKNTVDSKQFNLNGEEF